MMIQKPNEDRYDKLLEKYAESVEFDDTKGRVLRGESAVRFIGEFLPQEDRSAVETIEKQTLEIMDAMHAVTKVISDNKSDFAGLYCLSLRSLQGVDDGPDGNPEVVAKVDELIRQARAFE